jgi:phosphoglycolate phosphatase
VNALFDLDGTLVDPKRGLVHCVSYALERLAAPCPAPDVLTAFIGPPLRGMFATLLETADPERIERAVSLYRERYRDAGLYETQPYEGIRAMLEETSRLASSAFVATSKPAVFAKRILRHLDLDGYFAGVYGPELDGTFDDKADLLRHLLAEQHIPSHAAVMIGDRAADVFAAKANGIRSIGTLWGYGSREELVGAGADRLCKSPGELHRDILFTS